MSKRFNYKPRREGAYIVRAAESPSTRVSLEPGWEDRLRDIPPSEPTERDRSIAESVRRYLATPESS